jgi:xanthine dehydrogenase accessory factor
MREIWNELKKWREDGRKTALATVIKVSGSSLRPEGSKMLLSSDGSISGSVTGGCVEGAVFEETREVLQTGSAKLLSYGVTNEQAWEVGLSCGGSVEIFVESVDTPAWQEVYEKIAEALENNLLAVVATIVKGTQTGWKLFIQKDGAATGTLGGKEIDSELIKALPENWATHQPFTHTLSDGDVVFIDFIVPPPRLVIIGASHIAIPLVALANTLDYRTIVVDARSAFATRERFPHADELIVGWPTEVLEKLNIDAATCVVCLSHDDKLDNPSLLYAINSDARYIGALGSRVTTANRMSTLREEGATEDQLARIHAPVGLKIGGRSPAEIALSIMAEIVATSHEIEKH